MTNDYKPIACGAYDELEVLAMHRASVQVNLRGGDRVQGQACDTAIHDGAEFLVLESGGKKQALRLDQIEKILSPKGELLWGQKTDKSQ